MLFRSTSGTQVIHTLTPMGRRMLQRRMAAVSARIREVREELRIVDDQLSHLVDDADEKSLRALVAETPAAEFEHREARRHSDAMLRHRASLTGSLADLNAKMDELLDRMKETTP